MLRCKMSQWSDYSSKYPHKGYKTNLSKRKEIHQLGTKKYDIFKSTYEIYLLSGLKYLSCMWRTHSSPVTLRKKGWGYLWTSSEYETDPLYWELSLVWTSCWRLRRLHRIYPHELAFSRVLYNMPQRVIQ